MRPPAQKFTQRWITIIDVCREMGIEPDKTFTWPVGFTMQNLYYAKFKEQPPKENAPKTNGKGGVHCFAHYPPEWRERIEKEINIYQVERSKQDDLFAAAEASIDV